MYWIFCTPDWLSVAEKVSGTGALCQAVSAPLMVTTGVLVSAWTASGAVAALGVPGGKGGFLTPTVIVPAVAMSAAARGSVSCVALTNVVDDLSTPFRVMRAPLTKPLPVTVRTSFFTEPAHTEVGEIEVNTGAAGALTV